MRAIGPFPTESAKALCCLIDIGRGIDCGRVVELDHGNRGGMFRSAALIARTRRSGTYRITRLVNGVVHVAAPSPEAAFTNLFRD